MRGGCLVDVSRGMEGAGWYMRREQFQAGSGKVCPEATLRSPWGGLFKRSYLSPNTN